MHGITCKHLANFVIAPRRGCVSNGGQVGRGRIECPARSRGITSYRFQGLSMFRNVPINQRAAPLGLSGPLISALAFVLRRSRKKVVSNALTLTFVENALSVPRTRETGAKSEQRRRSAAARLRVNGD